MKHADAMVLAEEALRALTLYCERISIAGSIRRRKPEVGDIEIVCIPKRIPSGLFGDALEVDPDFCAAVNQWPKIIGEPSGKLTRRTLPGGMVLDLFIATPEDWGWSLCLYTGSKEFNQHVLLRAMHQRGYTSNERTLRYLGKVLPTPEEMDVFQVLGIPWVEPWAREV